MYFLSRLGSSPTKEAAMKYLLFCICTLGHCTQYVTCDFRGQLCNQMWTAAAVIGYALEHDCEAIFPKLKDAINGEENYRTIFHRLNVSECSENFVNFTEIHSHRYEDIPYKTNVNLSLNGHFESTKYFEKHSEIIRELFSPTAEILQEIHTKYGSLLQSHPVAVHVRTYIPDGRDPNNNIGGANWGYFITSMDYFPQDTHFLVFSDSITWTKNNFPSRDRNVTFVEGNPAHIDFYLMSLCDHVIVSPESTFSWWAAWLNRNPNKIVIVADTWGDLFANDTIPSGWLKLPKKSPFHFIRQP